MPNWCEGTLKVRGNPQNILRFINEGLNVYTVNDEKLDKKEWLEIHDNGGSFEVFFNKKDIYVEGTKRAFINLSSISNEYVDINKKAEFEVCCFAVSQAWGFKKEDWMAIAKKYCIDIKLYGIERGMGFVEDWLITDCGETFIDNSPVFEDYKDFLWNCPIPFLGG